MRNWWTVVVVFAAVVCASGSTAVTEEQALPTGPVAITTAGKIAHHNRGAVDGFGDAFFKYHDKSFDTAFALDHAALRRLDQADITADAEPWPGPVRLRGPLLADVLASAGAEGGTVTLYRLDGYGVELSPADLAAHRWVLALEADGKPLGLGGRGPAWLAYGTPGNSKASTDEEGKWVWSVFYITVE